MLFIDWLIMCLCWRNIYLGLLHIFWVIWILFHIEFLELYILDIPPLSDEYFVIKHLLMFISNSFTFYIYFYHPPWNDFNDLCELRVSWMRSSIFSGLFIENAEQFPPMHDFMTLSNISWQRCADLLLGSLLSPIDLFDSFVIVACCFITTILYYSLKIARLMLSFLLYLLKLVLSLRYY